MISGEPRNGASLILVAGLLIAGCSPQLDVANLDSAGSSIVCFGDSLTQGIGATHGRDYPSVLAKAIGLPIINAGVSGDTTEDGLRRLERDVLTHNPGLVIVAFGANDFASRASTDEIFGRLEEMVRRIQDAGAMVVLVGHNWPSFVGGISVRYEKLAKRRKAALVSDIMREIWSDQSLKSDSIHPNDAGYALMAERIREVVEPLIEASSLR